MSKFVDFINEGKIGLLYRGMSKTECERLLGLPSKWIGKPPCIGPIILTPKESDVWFFYEANVGISFNKEGISRSVHLSPENMDKSPQLFSDWPIPANPTFGDLRKALVEWKVPFKEGDPGSRHYWIITKSNTYAYSLTGGIMFNRDRPITMLANCSSRHEAEDAVGLFPGRPRPTN
jgi:hypothetical protein